MREPQDSRSGLLRLFRRREAGLRCPPTRPVRTLAEATGWKAGNAPVTALHRGEIAARIFDTNCRADERPAAKKRAGRELRAGPFLRNRRVRLPAISIPNAGGRKMGWAPPPISPAPTRGP